MTTRTLLAGRGSPRGVRHSVRGCSLVAALALLLSACAPDQGAPLRPQSGGTASSTAVPPALRPTVAMIDGQPVAPSELWPAMAEAAGGDALRELLIDRLVRAELLRRGISVDATTAERERTALLASLSDDPLEAARLLESFRERQRLGPVRFAALLRRTASLRALVADQVEITESALRLAHELATAPRRQVRIALLPSLSECDRFIARVQAGESFAEVATDLSSDASAARGGLLEPIAAADASWPESLRTAIFALRAGEISSPVLMDQGYAIASLVRELPPTGRAFEQMRPELERTVRLAQERILMDQLARRIQREAQVTVFDDALEFGWRPVSSGTR